MRGRYLISYDISDPKRWRKVYRTLRGYGEPVQYSVFRADLAPTERVLMMDAVRAHIHHEQDRVMVVYLGPAGGKARSAIAWMGRPGETGPVDRVAVIV